MTSIEALFDNHLADLDNVYQHDENKFICPICCEEFSRDAISQEKLSIGHVWPEYIREKSSSEITDQQVVLLCKRCNSTTGSRGDKQMQLREMIKDAEREGKIYGERRMQVIFNPRSEPVNLCATSSVQETRSTIRGRITFRIDETTGKWIKNNPQEQERFLSIEQNSAFSIVIQPHHELKANLSQVGWITSAYLFAFYTLGYRYILNDYLYPVRKYILDSFGGVSKENLRFPKSDRIELWECSDHFYQDPEIGAVIPVDGKSPVYFQISFLDYRVKLPFRFAPYVLQALIFSVPEICNQFPTIIKNKESLYSPIACNKSDGHGCIWDYILGKPIL